MNAPGLPLDIPFACELTLRPCTLTLPMPKMPDDDEYRAPPPETREQWIERLRCMLQGALLTG